MHKTVSSIPVHDQEKTIYSIHFQSDFEGLAKAIRPFSLADKKLCIVTDSSVSALYLEKVKSILEGEVGILTEFVFPAGEASKNLQTVQALYEHLILARFERSDMLLALGGGVVGDLTGFAAATYLRGISFIQVPTTLLAQVDSSIGGKTGVDFDAYKNMVGAFHQPSLVYINVAALKTLNEEQFACGMGEVLKHGLIKSAEYYEWVIEHMDEINQRDPDSLLPMIEESCQIKRKVVEKDPKEKGERALLNFGHTVGHAVEKQMNFQLLHGQCVAIGCIAAAFISWQRGWLSEEEFFEIRDMNVGFDLPISIQNLEEQQLLETTKSDKKMTQGHVKFILLKEIGKAVISHDVTDTEILASIHYLLTGEM